MALIKSQAVDTREKIVQAAVLSFSAKGFRAATVKEIAGLANVNMITVFRYFPRKRDLYWAAIDHGMRAAGIAEAFADPLCLEGEPRELLRHMAENILRMFRDDPSLLRLLYFTALELPAEKQTLYTAHITPLISTLTTRIKAWMQEGKLRAVDPETAAMSVAGGLLMYSQLQGLFASNPANIDLGNLASEFVDRCLRGLESELQPVGLQASVRIRQRETTQHR